MQLPLRGFPDDTCATEPFSAHYMKMRTPAANDFYQRIKVTSVAHVVAHICKSACARYDVVDCRACVCAD